jgi:hypothetical protein
MAGRYGLGVQIISFILNYSTTEAVPTATSNPGPTAFPTEFETARTCITVSYPDPGFHGNMSGTCMSYAYYIP